MQDHYFALWLGKWTTAIDWTAAVLNTYVAATLSSLSGSVDYAMPGTFDKSQKLDIEAQMVENEINRYFAQSGSYYFGEDHFAIRLQAYDDILWVVLGWLESIQFIQKHSQAHYTSNGAEGEGFRRNEEWHARQFIPAFAHRARVFYELAEQGWDWRLCGGGMTWNPRLLPYKNAITNQLFISASISMYLHFPGDENCSPFLARSPLTPDNSCDQAVRGQYDPTYLAAAINGYDWLRNSGMLNAQGLYTDGFHITGYRSNHSKTTCDDRNDMVYTYNQGVVLSGLRGLWEATGNATYLTDGHELVRNVIRATGWKASDSQTRRSTDDAERQSKFPWHGLGTNGILIELCDPSGRCNQDAQSFKGIFFHHLTAFCTPLPIRPARPGKTHAATRDLAALHHRSCRSYTGWVVRNAEAALETRDEEGRFGGWWGAPEALTPNGAEDGDARAAERRRAAHLAASFDALLPPGAVDYRNRIVSDTDKEGEYSATSSEDRDTWDTGGRAETMHVFTGGDLNDRGRGRTVETQGSGLAVVRAMWEFLRLREETEGI